MMKGGFNQSKTDTLFCHGLYSSGCFERQLSNTTLGNLELLIKLNRIKKACGSVDRKQDITLHCARLYFCLHQTINYKKYPQKVEVHSQGEKSRVSKHSSIDYNIDNITTPDNPCTKNTSFHTFCC